MELAAAFRFAPIYAIYDTQVFRDLPCAEVTAAWLRAGIRVLQYRHKGEFGRKQFAECADTAAQARACGALFVVNDRADAALLAGAAGVHVGQHDLAPSDVRKLLPPQAIVGHSTHNAGQLQAALAVPPIRIDYVAVGPIFATSSKENPDPVVGLQLVKQARAMTQLPLVAIGGITEENLLDVLQAGADAVALISGLASGCVSPAQMEARAGRLLALAATAKASPPAAAAP